MQFKGQNMKNLARHHSCELHRILSTAAQLTAETNRFSFFSAYGTLYTRSWPLSQPELTTGS
jgi:hypothetical protein